MKKTTLLYVLSTIIPCISFAQYDLKSDHTWIIGYDSQLNVPSVSILDFNHSKVMVSGAEKRNIGFYEFNTSISDESGKLLFYSNGCVLRNRNHNIPEGADSINYKEKTICFEEGLRVLQGGLILPLPQTKDTFMFFHKTFETTDDPRLDYVFGLYATKLYAKDSTVRVIYKNKRVINDTLSITEMTACRHANGKDWWIINPERANNKYRILLLRKDSIINMAEQTIGQTTLQGEDASSQSTFSPDGKYFVRARGVYTGGIHFFDFDRKIGKLNNPRFVSLNHNFIHSRLGVAFSSNSRFFYVTRDSFILQYDTQVNDFLNQPDTVARWQPFTDPDTKGFRTVFSFAQLAPDCRIYMTTGGSQHFMHTILYPNRKGKACGVFQNQLRMPSRIAWGTPNFPHFRLGAEGAIHTPCDSTMAFSIPVSTNDELDAHKMTFAIYPNPAQDHVNVDLFGYVQQFERGIWDLYDMSGKRVLSYPLLQGHSEYVFDTSSLSNGVYVWRVSFNGIQTNYAGKIIILKG